MASVTRRQLFAGAVGVASVGDSAGHLTRLSEPVACAGLNRADAGRSGQRRTRSNAAGSRHRSTPETFVICPGSVSAWLPVERH